MQHLQKLPSQHRTFTPWQDARLLFIFFGLWKLIILGIVAFAPAPGYDTSSTLLGNSDVQAISTSNAGDVSTSLARIVKFVRWDAIYFSQIVRRGYVFEQEWAFASGFPGLVAFVQRGILKDKSIDSIFTIALLGVALSSLCHLLSVFLLYGLGRTIFCQSSQSRSALPFTIAALHIINPAGAFLSSLYSEAMFSFLNILGFQLYLNALRNRRQKSTMFAKIQCLAAGAVFGCATTVRSNGLLSGALFLYEAAATAVSLFNGDLSVENYGWLIVIGIGGCLTALGAIIPQYGAYLRYCTIDTGHKTRMWCNDFIPSIYGWVQRHYWDVGLLRYWTVSNLPLFLLAAPTIFALCRSSVWAWRGNTDSLKHSIPHSSARSNSNFELDCLRRLAVPQALLAVMALLSYHVQIISRLSSAYPLWYFWLFSTTRLSQPKGKMDPYCAQPKVIVRWMVIYAMVQAALFASFLPPA